MRIHTLDHRIPCNCEDGTDCHHNVNAEQEALDALIAAFAKELRRRVQAQRRAGRTGWDDEAYTPEQIKQSIVKHLEQGDSVDIGVLAAFLWNRT